MKFRAPDDIPTGYRRLFSRLQEVQRALDAAQQELDHAVNVKGDLWEELSHRIAGVRSHATETLLHLNDRVRRRD